MFPPVTPRARAVLYAAVLAATVLAWWLHARAWDLGGRSAVLNYDTAQYALAAREVAEHGHWQTSFALPIELGRHPRPPWPLAVVQPGLVALEAALFAAFGAHDWLTLVFPALCFAAVALGLCAAGLRLAGPWGGLAAALAFALDPEAQHFAAGGFTEMPFTLGLLAALALLATGAAGRRPLVFGLLLGAAGSLRAQMAFFLPVLAAAAALAAPAPRRGRVLLATGFGFALVLAPWWLYKWRVFGDPGWDLTRLVVWEGVDGNSWFSLLHLPDPPALPHGAAAWWKLGGKALHNLPELALALTVGVRGALLIALIAALVGLRPPRPVAAAGWTALVLLGISVLLAAASIPWMRFVFPVRALAEAAGLWALLALIRRAPARYSPALLRGVAVALVLAWALFQCARGLAEAREVSRHRGLPGTAELRALAAETERLTQPGEVVMSNLGPVLAWHARRPVLHLALSPGDLRPCRRRLEFRRVLLAFRDPAQAWSGWRAVMERGARMQFEPEWNVAEAREARTADGFHVVWLLLGPPPVQLAAVQHMPAPPPLAALETRR
jgi:4-amino-4-deoxy-L-arabinose transferase-like glycosyltransferase